MAVAGRKKDPTWLYFYEEVTILGKRIKANCKIHGKAMKGLVARMKNIL